MHHRPKLQIRALFDTVTTISGEEKEEFLRFASRIIMLQWLPERRATAQDLLDDPWSLPI
jgi:serine/threonine-protein kinase SRPK3